MCLPLHDLDERTLAKGEHCGFEWQVVPNSMGYRCGYIRVLPGHPWFGKPYDDIEAECHGGLTFGEHGTACPTHGSEAEYWYGFDCAHGGDAPDPDLMDEATRKYHFESRARINARFPMLRSYVETIKSTAYVERECRSLCEQAQAALAATAA